MAGFMKSNDVDISSPERKVKLSPRQREILECLKAGKANKEIAHELGIGIGTVKQHLVVLFKKLGVTNRAMAVAKGMSAEGVSSMKANPFSEHPDRIAERRPAVVLSLQLTSSDGDADGKLKKDYYKIFTCVAFDFDAVFLRQSDFRCEMIFGIRSIRHHDVLRSIRAAVAVSEDVRVHLKPGKTLKGGVSSGSLMASMDRRGKWTGETISGPVVAAARKLCSQAGDDTLRLDLPSRHMISFLGAEVSGTVPEYIPLRSTFSWTRRPLPTPASFIGRSDEIKTFKSHIKKLKKGTGGLLFVEGETGMGKSSLLRHFADICSANNIDCHTWVSPHPDSQPASPSLGRLVRPLTDKMDSVDDICNELRSRQYSNSTVIMIDDYHLLPMNCAKVMGQTIKKLTIKNKKLNAAVLFVLAGRGRLQLPYFPDFNTVILNQARLSDVEIKKIIKDILSKNNPETARMARLAAGVPVFAAEMAKEASCRPELHLSRDRSWPTLSLFFLVMERVCKIGVDRHLLYFAATMPDPVSLSGLRQSWIANGGDFEKELNKAINAGLLRKETAGGRKGKTVRFSHPFLRFVVNHMLEKNGSMPSR